VRGCGDGYVLSGWCRPVIVWPSLRRVPVRGIFLEGPLRQQPQHFGRMHLAVAGVLAVALAAVVQIAGATPAAATTIPVGSVEVVTASSGFSTGSSKTLAAVCPAARPRVLGGGFTTTGTHIVVTDLRPMGGNPDRYRVTAGFDEVGTSGSWQLVVYAYCSSAAPGWQVVSATSTTTSQAFNQVIATCPSGKVIVGSGGTLTGSAGQVELVTQGVGGLGANRMSAGGIEDITGFAGSWSVTGYAVCVTAGLVSDTQLVQNQTANDTTLTKNVSVTCPSGMRLTGSAIWSDVPGNAINLRPNNVTPTSVTATGRNDTGVASGWAQYVYGFCAK
jgi:hypothetical protein